MSPNVSKDIEDEANSYFQRIYNHPPHPTLSIDEVLEMLKRFQDSHNKREREVSRRCFFLIAAFCVIF
jgi:CCR4-NOT transcription complex subunit 1